MHDSMRGVDGKLVVGGADPTFIPAVPPFSGTLVSSWGVFGMPVGSTSVGGLIPRAVVQIGPPCPPLTLGGITLPVANSLEVNGISLFIGLRINQGINIKQGISQLQGTKCDVGAHTHTGVKNHTGASISSALKLAGKVFDFSGNFLASKKNFDIPHPTKKDWRLRHTCLEGPENAVYYRGRTNCNQIQLPEYWTNFVNPDTITVSITPIGTFQDVIVEKIESNTIFLSSKNNLPIDCFYHIFGERTDGERLIPEYLGNSPADYPGNSNEYSVSGWDYDVKSS